MELSIFSSWNPIKPFSCLCLLFPPLPPSSSLSTSLTILHPLPRTVSFFILYSCLSKVDLLPSAILHLQANPATGDSFCPHSLPARPQPTPHSAAYRRLSAPLSPRGLPGWPGFSKGTCLWDKETWRKKEAERRVGVQL